MSSTVSAALLLLVAAAHPTPKIPRAAVEVPEAVLAHPAAEADPSLQAVPPRWSLRALAAWGGPWVSRPGELYDHRYVTW